MVTPMLERLTGTLVPVSRFLPGLKTRRFHAPERSTLNSGTTTGTSASLTESVVVCWRSPVSANPLTLMTTSPYAIKFSHSR
ncbi:hypothetical protein POG23_22300 [Limnoraphis robusta]|nr:hypothetical protein [Limnoraphis robusta]